MTQEPDPRFAAIFGGKQATRSAGVLATLPGLTEDDLAAAESKAGESVGFFSGLTPDSPGAAVPGIRQGVRFQQERGYAEALGRIERGEGSRDDSLAVLDRLVDRSRKRTFMGGVGEMVQDFALTGAEILIPGMAVGRAAGAAAAAGARMGAGAGAAAMRALGSRAARTLGTLAVGAPAMREGLPRLVGLGGGSMSASALQRAMPGVQMTADEAGRLAVWMEESFADFLETDVPAWKGVVDEAIEMAAEATGGPLMKLPLLRQLQGAQVRVVEKLLGGVDNDVSRFLAGAARAGMYTSPIGEFFENRVATGGKAAVPGMEETFADVIPGTREAAQELIAAAAVGGAPVAVGAATVAGQQRRRETAQAGVREALGEDEQAPVPSPLDVEGGDPASAGPGATPEALGPATFRALAPEEREADVAAYRAALRATAAEDAAEPEVRVVEPRTRGELAVQALLRRRGIDPTFVEGGAADAPGFFPGPGRAVIARGTDAYGAGVHEALHTWWAQESAEGRRALELELESVDPGFLARVSEWRAENARIETPEMAREEALTTGGQVLASMARYLRTAQGAADFAVVHEESPGALRRAGEALVDALGTLVPRLPITRRAAARDRLAVLDSALASPGATARLAQATVRALDSIAPVFDAPPVAGEAEESAQEVARARATPEEQREARRLEREAIRTKQRQARASREAERAARPAEEAAALGLGSDEGSFEISAEIEAAVVAARDLRRVREAAARTEAQREAQAERVAVRAEGPKPSKPRGRVKPRVVEDTDEVAELRETSRDTASRAASFDPREFDEPAAEAAPVAEIEDDPFAGLGLPAGPGPLADQSLVERLALRTPAQRRARPITLVDHVLALGGFDMRGTDGRNEAAEIEEQIFGMGGRRRGGLPAGLLRGVGSKATARGLTPDDMREALRERGFVGRDGDGRMSFDAMIEAIGAEVGGDMPTLPAGDATLVEREVARQGRGASSGVDGLWDVAFGGAFAPSLATIEVDGVQRPRVNSDGRPIAASDDALRAFWRWFGGSKAVDTQGRPVALYHGTADDFTAFDTQESEDGGIYLTDRPVVADGYTERSTKALRDATRAYDAAREALLAEWPTKELGEPMPAWHLGRDESHSWDHYSGQAAEYGIAPDVVRRLDAVAQAVRDARWDMRRAEAASGAGRVLPVYARVLRPVDVDASQVPRWDLVNEPTLRRAREQQRDGAIIRNVVDTATGEEWASDIYVVFDPAQIKSATGNAGTFDPANPDIRFAPSLQNLLPAIPALDRARVSASVDWLRLRLQDDTVPLREVPEFRTAVKRSRAQAPDRIATFEREVDGLLKDARAAGASFTDVQRAMVLTAGIERNAWMLEDRGVENGAGFTSDEARRELAEIRARVGADKVNAFLEGIARLNKQRLDHLVETRMVDAAQAARWHKREPHWVSMRDLDMDADEHVGFQTSGRSVQVKNPQIRRAEGREDAAENPLIAWYSETIARMRAAEKNRAMHVGADLARKGAPGLKVIPKPQGVPGGFTPPADHVAFVDGAQQMYLVMASEDAAAALKGLNGEQTGFVLNAIGRLTRMFSRSVTGRNPFFWVPNFLRDTTQALWTVAAERDIRQGARVLGRAWAVLPGMIRYQLTGDSRAVPEIEAAKRAGFKTTWIGRQTLQELLDEFRVKVEGPSSIRDKVRASLSWLERMGDAFEMATRYAAFTHELEKQTARGVARPEAELRAADFARELTLNFDTRGTWTPALSSLYAFFNPAVQGSARLIRTALSGPRGYAAVGAVVVMGALMEALGYALADEDPETGLNEYGSIPEWEKSRNIVLPFKIGGAFPKITLPYGLDAIFGMGRRGLHFAADGGIDPRQTRWKALQEGVMHAGASFNPIGDIADPFAMAAPTVVRPFVEIERNQKFGGRPIMKDATNFGATLPDSARAFSTIDDRLSGWLALRIADVLNLGGPEELPTGLDVSPESIQHLIEFATAGFGLRELDRVSEFALSKREVRVASTAPVLRNFAAAVTDHHVSELYYGVRNTASTLHGLAKNAESPAEVAAIRERDPKAWALKERLGRIDRRLSQLGRVLRAGSLIPSEARAVREQMTAWQARIVRAYYGDTAAAQ